MRYARDTFLTLPRSLRSEDEPLACLRRLDGATAGRIAQDDLERLARLHAEAKRGVDKMPDNKLNPKQYTPITFV